MRKLFIGIAIAFIPFISTNASEHEQILNNTCSVQQKFGYVDFGIGPFPILFPSVKLGYRTQNNHHGVDIAIQGTSFYPAFSYVKGSLAYQYYFCPNLCSQVYVGLGLAGGKIYYDSSPCESICFLSPEVSFGKQSGDSFIQLTINSPIYHAIRIEPILKNYRSMYTPCITLSFGKQL